MSFRYSRWMELPLPTRNKIAENFGFKRVRSVHVSNNVTVDDGFNLKDVENAMALESLQKFLGTKDTNYDNLWMWTIDLAEGKTPLVNTVLDIPKEATLQPLVVKKAGRPKKTI